MRRLLPDVADEALDDLYTRLELPDPPSDRPHVYLDMVASADGAATLDGRTGGLGGEADRYAFSRLREWCDAILIGASTVRIEDYGPPRPVEAARARRTARGLAPVPRLVVVTATAQLEPAARLFADPSRRPTVLAPEDADPTRLGSLRLVADVLTVGRGRVELPAALHLLRRSGVRWLLCEGGPTLNAELLSAGLVDELFLTVTPQLVGASRRRIVHGEVRGGPCVLQLVELREHASELLLRYRLLRAGRSPLR